MVFTKYGRDSGYAAGVLGVPAEDKIGDLRRRLEDETDVRADDRTAPPVGAQIAMTLAQAHDVANDVDRLLDRVFGPEAEAPSVVNNGPKPVGLLPQLRDDAAALNQVLYGLRGRINKIMKELGDG